MFRSTRHNTTDLVFQTFSNKFEIFCHVIHDKTCDFFFRNFLYLVQFTRPTREMFRIDVKGLIGNPSGAILAVTVGNKVETRLSGPEWRGDY